MFSSQEEADFFKILSQNSQEGMLISDHCNKIVWINPAFSLITGFAVEELVGKSPNLLKSGKHSPEFYLQMWNSLKEQGFWQGEIWNRRKSGEVYPESLTISTLKDSQGQLKYYLAIISDLTQLKNYQKNMQTELELARKIQQKLLPQKTPYIPGLKISTYYQPMQAVGGDFYDFVDFMDNDYLGIFISDSSGHGVPAAFITSMVKTVLENSFSAHYFPGYLLKTINEKLLGKTDDGFLTAFYGVLNHKSRKFLYARAGHPYPILIRGDEIIELKSVGTLLGMVEDIVLEEQEILLKKGDKMLLFTDGLLETLNQEGVEFEESFFQLIEENKHLQIEDMMQVIQRELNNYSQNEVFDDDVCIVGLEIEA